MKNIIIMFIYLIYSFLKIIYTYMKFFYNLCYVKRLLFVLLISTIIIIYTKKQKYLLIPFICLGILIYFLRNNLNITDYNKKYFLSPSASKILSITKGKKYTTINTYLSLLDRHFMIAPCNCVIVNIERINENKKKFVEQLRITFKNEYGELFYLDQIVEKLGYPGYLLKFLYKYRTISFHEIGKKLKQGERYGLIRFGSNMIYKIPNTYKIKVKTKQHIEVGKILAIRNQ